MQVTVIGGGIVGLSCALELHRGGAEVTLVERYDCGRATSRGNAGWIIPATTLPTGTPGITMQALRWLSRPSSPARLRPRPDPALIRWCWHFWQHASGTRYEHALKAMLELSRHTVESYDALEALGIDFDMRDNGVLIAARTQAALDGFHKLFEDLERRDYPEFVASEDLSADAAQRLEPAINPNIAGGILLKHQRQVRPETVCNGVYRYLAGAGVDVRENTNVNALSRDTQQGWRVGTDAGELHADAIVIAAGLWSNALVEPLGFKFPLQGARGCSITARGSGTRPTHSIKMAERQIALNPFQDGVRLSGTWDLVGNNASLDRTRLRQVIDGASDYLADWQPDNVEFEWAGLRPSTPDSLPIIGPVPNHDGLFMATGHGMFGMTYGPLTGTAIKDMVLSGTTAAEFVPFNVERWLQLV